MLLLRLGFLNRLTLRQLPSGCSKRSETSFVLDWRERRNGSGEGAVNRVQRPLRTMVAALKGTAVVLSCSLMRVV